MIHRLLVYAVLMCDPPKELAISMTKSPARPSATGMSKHQLFKMGKTKIRWYPNIARDPGEVLQKYCVELSTLNFDNRERSST